MKICLLGLVRCAPMTARSSTLAGRHTEAFEQGLASGDYPVIGHVLVGCADLSLREGNPRLAAQLLGAAEAMNGSVDHSIPIASGSWMPRETPWAPRRSLPRTLTGWRPRWNRCPR